MCTLIIPVYKLHNIHTTSMYYPSQNNTHRHTRHMFAQKAVHYNIIKIYKLNGTMTSIINEHDNYYYYHPERF